MGEWRRILANPRRLMLLLLIVILNIIMFRVEQMEVKKTWQDVNQDIIWESQTAQILVEKYRGIELESLNLILTQEIQKMEDVYAWSRGWYEGNEDNITTILEEYEELNEQIANKTILSKKATQYKKLLETLAEQVEHWRSYPAYLEQIQEQAKKQSETSIFGNKDSFVYRNLQETARQFEILQDVEVEYGNNRGLELWVEYKTVDYFYVIFLVVILFGFFEERQKGLWSTVRSCYHGRLRLGLVRIGILSMGALIGAVLLYGANLVTSLMVEGGWGDLERSLQSLVCFKRCPLNISIRGWLFQYFAVKAASGFLLGMIIWCILGCVSNIQFSVTVLGAVFAGEYVLFQFLPVQSIWNPLKYFNLFSYVHTMDLYTNYLNINLLGYPVGIRQLAVMAIPVLILAAGWGVIWIQLRRYPEGNKDLLGRFALLWGKIMDGARRHFSIGGMELYKTLILQFGIILLIIVWYVSDHMGFFYAKVVSDSDRWYQEYLDDAEGPINADMDVYLQEARINAGDSGDLQYALDRLQSRVEELQKRAETGGYEPWLVDGMTYENIYGTVAQPIQWQNAAIALVLVTICCASIMAYERQSGVVLLLRSLRYGRSRVFIHKVIVTSLMVTAVWAMVYMTELWYYMQYYELKTLAAPVQNLDTMQRFPWKISIGEYMILIYGLRWLMLQATAWIVLWISSRSRNIEVSYMVNLGVLGMPALLFVFGIAVFGWISPVIPIGTVELLGYIGATGNKIYWIPFIVLLAVGGLALWRNGKKWIYR